MKKSIRKICLVSCSLLILLRVEAQMSRGIINIGRSGSQSGNSIIQTGDGGYAIAGYTNAYGAGGTDAYVVKLDNMGNEQWARTIGGPDSDVANAIVQANDGGYVIAGSTSSFGAGENDVYVIKLSAAGNLLWTKTIGGPLEDYGESVAKTYDGGYAIAGYTQSYGAGGYDMYIMKLDSAGNLLWTRTVGTPANDYGYSIVQTSDKGLAIAGGTLNFYSTTLSYIVKLDSAGNLLWTQVPPPLGNNVYHIAYSITQSADGGLVFTGDGIFSIMANPQVMVDKLSSSGGVLWVDKIDQGGFSGAYGVNSSMTDDASVITAVETSISLPISYLWTLKVDSAGALVWSNNIQDSITGESIVSTSDKGVAITGSNVSKMVLLKFDSTGSTCDSATIAGSVFLISGRDTAGGVTGTGGIAGSGGTAGTGFSDSVLCIQRLTSGINSPAQINPSIAVYPNPSSGLFNFVIESDGLQSHLFAEVYNVLGESVYSKSAIRNSQFLINLSGQPSGVYFYRVLNESGELIGEGKLEITH